MLTGQEKHRVTDFEKRLKEGYNRQNYHNVRNQTKGIQREY